MERKGGEGKRGWWDEECKEKKKEVRIKLREWRRWSKQEQEYKRGKRKYRDMCEKKKREESEN